MDVTAFAEFVAVYVPDKSVIVPVDVFEIPAVVEAVTFPVIVTVPVLELVIPIPDEPPVTFPLTTTIALAPVFEMAVAAPVFDPCALPFNVIVPVLEFIMQ